MAKRVEDRYRSMAEFARALAPLVHAVPVPARRRAWLTAAVLAAAASVAVVVLSAALVAAGLYFWGKHPEQRAATTAAPTSGPPPTPANKPPDPSNKVGPPANDNLGKAKLVYTLAGHEDGVLAVEACGDNAKKPTIVSTGRDKTIRF